MCDESKYKIKLNKMKGNLYIKRSATAEEKNIQISLLTPIPK